MTFLKQIIALLGISFFLLIPFIASSENIAIIESQSFHPMQVMDANWQTAASNMGHTASILPQSALDNISNFEDVDILIISSGLIDLPINRTETIKAFFEAGKSVYLQSEFLLSHPGNVLFEEIVSENGNTFNWEGESQGSITPMTVTGDLNNSLNNIEELSYYWYGTYGNGDNTIFPFLENSNKNYGFIYCPSSTSLGKIITTTDQDWIRTFTSEPLMQNILHVLINTIALQVTPTVSINLNEAPDCENGTYTFGSDIENTINGLYYQWQINGIPVTNETDDIFSTNDITEGDVVECIIWMDMGCSEYLHTSNPILIAPIVPQGEVAISITSDQTIVCTGSTIQFSSQIDSEVNPTIVSYQWQINNQVVPGANASTFTTSTLENNDIVLCILDYTDSCGENQISISNEVSITIESESVPTILILTNDATACEGQDITFTAQGSYWGVQPTLQWQVDGLNVGLNNSSLTINSLTDGQEVTCLLTSSETCVIINQVVSAPITVTISEPFVPSLFVSVDQTSICQNETITFTATGDNWGDNPFFSWTVNGQTVGDNNAVFTTNNLLDAAEVICSVQFNESCLSTNELNTIAEPVTVQTPVTPLISISSDQSQSCAGSMVTFTSEIQNEGSNPILQWSIDGNPVGTGTTTFSTTDLQNGQIISCQLLSDEYCATSNSAISNEIGIAISDIDLIVNQQRDDYCGQGNGKIQVGVNNAILPVSYIWNNGLTTSTINDLSAGQYTVTATDALGCSTTLSTEILEVAGLEIAELSLDMVDCSGNNGTAFVQMKDTDRNYNYTWTTETGEVVGLTEFAKNLFPGKYLLEVADDTGCYLTESFIIDGSSVISLEMDNRLISTWGETEKLEPYIAGSGELTYEWFPTDGLSCSDCPNPTFVAQEQIEYTLTVTNETGCSESQSILIVVKKVHDVFIPNAFSPNGDGNNDFFTVYAGDNVHNIKTLQVADRWGNILFGNQNFEAGNDQAGWDGTFKGKRANVGVYLFTLEVAFADGTVKAFSGDITLAR